MKAMIDVSCFRALMPTLPARLANCVSFTFYGHVFQVFSTLPCHARYISRVYRYFQNPDTHEPAPETVHRMFIIDPSSDAAAGLCAELLHCRSAKGYLLISEWLPFALVLASPALVDYYASKTLRLAIVETMLETHLTLHAASLCSPSGEGILLVGEAAAGKTSTTLSLLAEGFWLGSDDTTCIDRESKDCSCFPLPLLSRVPFSRNSHPDIFVAGERRYFAELHCRIRRVICPSRIFFLDLTSPGSPGIVPMRRSDAVVSLIRNVMFPLCVDLVRRDAIIAESLPVLASLADQTQSFRVDRLDRERLVQYILKAVQSKESV